MRFITVLIFTLTCIAYGQKEDLPVRIYILVGQSNMQGKAGIEGDGAGTLRSIVKNDSKKEFQFLVDKDGKWIERQDVWINLLGTRYSVLKPGYGSQSGQIGPELGFGHKIGDVTKGQVLIIKAAWGGKSLGNDFLPPSVGKYPKPMMPGHPGFYYHEILRIVKDVTENIRTYFPDYKDQGIAFAGICYHQGWNDQYGGLDAKYESNMAAFINDIRSSEHGLGVPNLPFVIATSGMIEKETPIKEGQLAMGDKEKYPQFAGNVAVVDTDKPYGPDKMTFKFYTKKSSQKVGYHWNGHAASYTNIGRAMAHAMQELDQPKLPSRLVAYGTAKGVQLTWQLGSEAVKSIKLLRNGEVLETTLPAKKTVFLDTEALPGKNVYELVLDMSASPQQKLTASSDTSVTELTSYRSKEGVMLQWKARGKYEGFKILRDGKVIAEKIPGDVRSYEDKTAPDKGMVSYTILPIKGKATPAVLSVNRGPIDPGKALVYEPFDYPSGAKDPESLLGMQGAVGTRGAYYTLEAKKATHLPRVIAGGLNYGALPVTGNRAHDHHWGAGCAIDLDDSIQQAGLLKDGATMWVSFLYHLHKKHVGAQLSLQSSDGKEAIGFFHRGVTNTFIIQDGKRKERLLTKGVVMGKTYLFVAKIVWGKDGKPDSMFPYDVQRDLKLPERHGRIFTEPFNIDQTKLSRIALQGGGASDIDEIRVGPTFESVVGGEPTIHKEAEEILKEK